MSIGPSWRRHEVSLTMCGRFTNKLTWDEIVRLYRLTIKAPPHNLPPRYNICPTDPVDVVTERDGSRDFVRMRWGLVPSWWPKPLKDWKAATFNARTETVADKPFFRERGDCRIAAFRSRQCRGRYRDYCQSAFD